MLEALTNYLNMIFRGTAVIPSPLLTHFCNKEFPSDVNRLDLVMSLDEAVLFEGGAEELGLNVQYIKKVVGKQKENGNYQFEIELCTSM